MTIGKKNANATDVSAGSNVFNQMNDRVNREETANHGKSVLTLSGTTDTLTVASGGSVAAMTLPRVARNSGVYFVRCEVVDDDGSVLAENIYWQSQQRDDLGDPTNDWAFELKQVSWADMTALNWMPRGVPIYSDPDWHQGPF